MLGVAGNGDVLKPLIILEKNSPLVGEGESEHIPEEILLSKTAKGSIDQDLFVQWSETAVPLDFGQSWLAIFYQGD